MKRKIINFGIAILMIIPLGGVIAQESKLIRKVVIDAGHGGRDPGASGKHCKEKDIALKIALKTGYYIEKYLPDVEVFYTRKTDKFIELYRRAQVANENEADLFISIHCNANNSSRIYGAETYVMGLHKNEANLEVAKLENASILKEDDYEDQYEGFDPNSDLAYIIFNVYQNEFLDKSLNFATKVQDQFRERVGLKDRSVLQAGFLVLYKTTMPSVLVETGYLTNTKDEKFLMSEDGQVYIASAIYRAFKAYKNEMEKYYTPEDLIASVNPSDLEKEKKPETPTGNKTEINTNDDPIEENKEEETNELIFRVQFATSPKDIPLNDRKFKGLPDVWKYKHSGLFKFTVGQFGNFDMANALKKEMRNKGYKDAFVVAFVNNERIAISKAKKLSKE